MPSKSGRIVRRTLSDGTVREYRYPPHNTPSRQRDPESVGALILSYRISQKWKALAASTRVNYTIYLKVLEADADTPVSAVKRRDLLALRDAVAETRGTGAANGFVRAAGSLFSWAVERGWIEITPMHKVRGLPSVPLRAWTAEHVRLALDYLPPWLGRAVFLAAATAQRRGDLLALRWPDYDGRALRFTQQKTGQKMVLPLPDGVVAVLAVWRSEAGPEDHILLNAHGRPWTVDHFSIYLHRALLEVPGFPAGLNIHGVRKFKAADLADRGATTHEIAAVTGHQTLAMVQFYTKSVNQERLAGAALAGQPKGTIEKMSRRNR